MDFGSVLGGYGFWGVMGAGLLFGLIYNYLISWLHENERLEGYTAVSVVLGVVVTLLLAALVVGVEAALVVGAIFVATGLPMILGDIWRAIQRREHSAQELREALGLEYDRASEG